jgi:hypothetical protein
MGYFRHQAVIAMTYGDDDQPDVPAFRAGLPEHFARLVIGPIPTVVNVCRLYAFLPDGSKEGWDTSNEGDEHRDAFLALFSRATVMQAAWGDDEPQISVDWISV